MYEILRSKVLLISAFACIRTVNERGAKGSPCTPMCGDKWLQINRGTTT